MFSNKISGSELSKISITKDPKYTRKICRTERLVNLLKTFVLQKDIHFCRAVRRELSKTYPILDHTHIELSFDTLKFLGVSINGYLWKVLRLAQLSNLFSCQL
jgi:hypothetical protein